jgi:hypothetical protein
VVSESNQGEKEEKGVMQRRWGWKREWERE